MATPRTLPPPTPHYFSTADKGGCLRHAGLTSRSLGLTLVTGSRSKAVVASINNGTHLPRRWYNLVADLHLKPPPTLHPKTFKPINPQDLSHLFPDALIEQEASNERFIDIPEQVLEVYKLWRPTPLIRAKRLEKLLETPARIYYKYEGVSPAGSHKPNTAVPQVILMAMCGHGHFDLPAYDKYLRGNLVDLSFSEERIRSSLENIPLIR
uniref:Uncharacterized protein n=1 Tax=Kalanchoe fedtschenkoi TaxID=63787 RepID=A0A7N0ZSY6_KALFE